MTCFPDFDENLRARHSRHHHVQNDEIENFARKYVESRLAVVRRFDFKTFQGEIVNEQRDEFHIVINDENFGGTGIHGKSFLIVSAPAAS